MMKWRRIESSEQREEFYNWLRQHKLNDCHAKWNGNGEAVLHEAWLLATSRGYFYDKLLKEAARNMGICETTVAEDYCIITPRDVTTRERAARHFNASNTNMQDELQEIDEKLKLKYRKTRLLKRINELKSKDSLVAECIAKLEHRKTLTEEEIAQLKKKLGLYKQTELFEEA